MNPTLVVLACWLVFGGSHLALSSMGLRTAVVQRFGERIFIVGYSTISAFTLTLLAIAVMFVGDEGMANPFLVQWFTLKWVLGALVALGLLLVAAGLAGYSRSPMAELARRTRLKGRADQPLNPPSRLERVTHHPFFVGVILMMGSHVFLVEHLATAVFFGGFVLLSGAGMVAQDRKLLARHGEVYREYLDQTDAASTERTSFSGGYVVAAIILLIAAGHPLWALSNGGLYALLTVAGGVLAVARQLMRAPAT